jgi:hypothetical protein
MAEREGLSSKNTRAHRTPGLAVRHWYDVTEFDDRVKL